MATDISIYFLQ